MDIWDARYRAQNHNANVGDCYSPNGQHCILAQFEAEDVVLAYTLDMIDSGGFDGLKVVSVGPTSLVIWEA